jgi:hypothetical protein
VRLCSEPANRDGLTVAYIGFFAKRVFLLDCVQRWEVVLFVRTVCKDPIFFHENPQPSGGDGIRCAEQCNAQLFCAAPTMRGTWHLHNRQRFKNEHFLTPVLVATRHCSATLS